MSKFKQQLPLPLEIDCTGLSRKLIRDLADRLSVHFVDVITHDDSITAAKPFNMKSYADAWDIIDRYGVKAR